MANETKSSAGIIAEEEQFLSEYSAEAYERPSVATDIAAFSLHTEKANVYRKNPEQKLSLLLIKRGEHPYLNAWALPGGFVRPNETVEECAYREIREESNLEPVSLIQVDVFSKPERDPRCRVISVAYASIIAEEQSKIRGGDDAVDAGWFEVKFTSSGENECKLTLTNGSTVLGALLEEKKTVFGKTYFDIRENDGLAFDHAEIIASALSSLRKEAERFEIVFDFLPEKFTLTALQRVQETLMGISHLAPNFRRKVADYVIETDEFTEGAGHRPARLYKRKTK